MEEKLSRYRDPKIAQDYDRRWSSFFSARRDRRKRRTLELALAEFPSARTVLDVPCGTGRFADLLSARGLNYLGADFSPAMLNQARRKHAGARWFAADLAHLPLPDESVDLALSIRFFHLVSDPERRHEFLRELARVARLGVIADFRHDRSLSARLRRVRHSLGLTRRETENLSLDAIRAELARVGLEARAFRYPRRSPLLTEKVVVVAAKRAPEARPGR